MTKEQPKEVLAVRVDESTVCPNANNANEVREKDVIVFGFIRCLPNSLPLTESQNFKSSANSISVGKDAEKCQTWMHTLRAYQYCQNSLTEFDNFKTSQNRELG